MLATGGRCVLAVDEEIRYSNARKHGYHGGGSPQEVLAPLLVLAPGLADCLAGWVETGYDPPAWWTGQAVPDRRRPKLAPVTAGRRTGGQLILSEQTAPEAAPAWIAELLGAETFIAQRAAASRSAGSGGASRSRSSRRSTTPAASYCRMRSLAGSTSRRCGCEARSP